MAILVIFIVIITIIVLLLYLLFKRLGFKKGFKVLGIGMASISLILYLLYRNMIYNHYISYVPHKIHASEIIYMEYEAWGFGPGGNETGVIVYELPNKASRQILDQGMNYFKKLNDIQIYGRNDSNRKGIYEKWEIAPNKDFNISSFLNRYGFGIDIDSSVVKMINEIMNSDSSYYAYGRTGIIMISPTKKRIIFAYSG